ncbi:aspartate ammonia-lyase [Thermoanaerobacter sp. CM-CNRG TB177]|uniref:aspartate ammonia-lyase n=1 Tax=Thermoanaerobacter sp. CM-CNRG TB177 TaxID=2800659 RepID=UPI001BDF3A92|nr:aspartate ammonia-lyase [Thermoanaerobacter sp. CM-CNRG TB177]MBT1279759.1 aspartate ammonia-lyase [Thermoanaerobacter sp. CM-CNRG TB177]
MKYRIEHDLLGQKEVPVDAYYGIHTLRAYENFNISGQKIHRELIISLAMVKKAAAIANMKAGLLDERRAKAIILACDEIISGKYHDQFIVDALQGGAGTSSNMNANEVIANRAIELLGGSKGDYSIVHPLEHVNLSQSTNDVFPTAVRIAAIRLLKPLSEDLAELQSVLQEKEEEFSDVCKMGRTELQDALPVMLGQEFGAYAQAVARDRWRIYKVEERLRQVNIGGTAVGTGVNAELKYIFSVIEILREITGLGLARAEYMMDPTQNNDVFVEVSGLLKAAATNLIKISNDIRLMSSGPKCGLMEINIPEVQAGSSIMPGKVNPVIPEAVKQAAFQVIACDHAITLCVQAGEFELNFTLPQIAYNLFMQIDLLRNAIRIFIDKCIKGITANKDYLKETIEKSYSYATVLVPYLGYEKATEIAKMAKEKGKTIREVVLEAGLFTEEELNIIFNPYEMTKPGIPGKRKLKGEKRL